MRKFSPFILLIPLLIIAGPALARSVKPVDPCDRMVEVASREYTPRVLRAFGRTHQRADIEDASQKAITALLLTCRQKGPSAIESPENWLFIVTKRKLSWAGAGSDAELPENLAAAPTRMTPVAPIPARDVQAAAERLSRVLSEKQLMTLQETFFNERSAQEIADARGVPITAIQGQLRDGKDALSRVAATLEPQLRFSPGPNRETQRSDMLFFVCAIIVGVALFIVMGMGVVAAGSCWRDLEEASRKASEKAADARAANARAASAKAETRAVAYARR